MLRQSLLDRFAQLDEPVSVDSFQCTKVRFQKSSCTACLDVCPLNAIEIGNQVNINSSCDSCGKCTQVCPTGVFSLNEFTRRGLLSSFRDTVEHEVTHVVKSHMSKDVYATKIPKERELLPYGVVTVSDACDGCMLCVNLCPTGALSGEDLTFEQFRCTSCNLCAEVCPQRAITIKSVSSCDSRDKTVLKKVEQF